MKQQRIEMILRADQPIAHHSESFGNSAVAMRRKIRQPDGSFQHVPIITGDTMRHGLREASSYALLDAAGLLGDPCLSEAALRLLFAGGQITGSAGGAVKLGDYREMVDLIPTLGLFGGCAQNRAIPGRIHVDDATLVCDETAHVLPEWVGAYLDGIGDRTDTHRAHVEEVQRVRMDPSLDPGKRRLLTAGDAESVELRLLRSENASEMGDQREKEAQKSTMLPRSFERIVQGSLFYWSVTATTYSALDEDTMWTAILAFAVSPYAGGKRGTGHGRLKVIHARDLELARPAEAVSFALASKEQAKGAMFRAHVAERSAKIRDFLAKVAA